MGDVIDIANETAHRPGAKLTGIQRRLLDARAEIDRTQPRDLAFLHSNFCQLGLPRRHVTQSSFQRQTGHTSIVVEAGSLWCGDKWETQPLPYGSRARLVLIHLCSRAIACQSPEIEVGKSLGEFLKRLQIDPCGAEYQRVGRQVRALAACTIKLGFGDGRVAPATTLASRPFRAWQSPEGKWGSVIVLTQEFYESVASHSVPLHPKALGALRHSALALDLYSWMAHRLHRLEKPLRLGWETLQEQFGHEYRAQRDFRREFLKALEQVNDAYPAAQVQRPSRGGLCFLPSPPPIARKNL